MDRRIYILATLLIALLHFSAAGLHAQPKAVSSSWSFSGIGLGYEHMVNDSGFVQIDLKTDTVDLFNERHWTPGGTLSFTWNMIFKNIVSPYGTNVNFYAGPGAVLGWSDDSKAPAGAIFGIKGRVGAELTFRRDVSISVSTSPSLAMHLSADDGEYNMRTYRNGLVYGLIPEIGIKYCF